MSCFLSLSLFAICLVQHAELQDNNFVFDKDASTALNAKGYQKIGNLKLKWFDVGKKFFDANHTCQLFGLGSSTAGRLALPRNEQEFKLIKQFIKGHPRLKGNREIWLGGDDLLREGQFRWFDGSIIPYSYFRDGKPNNYKWSCARDAQKFQYKVYGAYRYVNVYENCVTIYKYDTNLNDMCCGNEKTFLCQMLDH